MKSLRPTVFVITLALCVLTMLPLTERARCPISFDEAITLLEVSGQANPQWPQRAEPAHEVVDRYLHQTGSFSKVTKGLIEIDIHPPLYYWILWLWRQAVAPSLFVSRMMSVVLTSVTVLFLILIARHQRFWWLAGLLFGLGGAAYHYGPLARNYALTRLLVTLMLFLVVRAQSLAMGIILAFVGALAFATHYLALFPTLTILGYHILSQWSRQRVRAVLPATVFVALCLPVFPALVRAMGLRPDQYTGFVGWASEAAYVFRGLAMQIVSQPQQLGLPVGRITILLGGLLILIVSSWALFSDRGGPEIRVATIAVLGHAVGLVVLFASTNKTLVTNDGAPRFLGIVAPFISLILAAFVSSLNNKKPLVPACLLLAYLVGADLYSRQKCSGTLRLDPAMVPPGATVVVGEGFDHGSPAIIALQVPQDVGICVLTSETSCLTESLGAPIYFPASENSPSRPFEKLFLERCSKCQIASKGYLLQ